MRTLFGPIFLGKAPIERAQRAQTRTATMAPEQKHLPLRKRLSANEAWIEQRLISGRIKCPYDVEIASRCPSGGGESLIGQLLEAPLSLGQPLAVVLSKKNTCCPLCGPLRSGQPWNRTPLFVVPDAQEAFGRGYVPNFRPWRSGQADH